MISWSEATAQVRTNGCNFDGAPSLYMGHDGTYVCRCIVCGRCEHHTGNSTQGHYWAVCHVQRKFHDLHKTKALMDCKKCMPDFHFCCKDDCELFEQDGTKKK